MFSPVARVLVSEAGRCRVSASLPELPGARTQLAPQIAGSAAFELRFSLHRWTGSTLRVRDGLSLANVRTGRSLRLRVGRRTT